MWWIPCTLIPFLLTGESYKTALGQKYWGNTIHAFGTTVWELMYHQPPSKLRGLPAANTPNINYPEPIGQPTLPALHGFSGSHGHRRPFRYFFFPRSLPPQQLNVIPAVRPHFPSAGLISRKLCSGWQPGDSSLPCTSKLQRDADIPGAYQGTAEQKTTPCTPRMQTLMHFFSTSTHPLPAVSFLRRNFSARRFCSSLLIQGLAQPSCSRDGVRWSLEVLQSDTTALASPHTLTAVFVRSSDGGRISPVFT